MLSVGKDRHHPVETCCPGKEDILGCDEGSILSKAKREKGEGEEIWKQVPGRGPKFGVEMKKIIKRKSS